MRNAFCTVLLVGGILALLLAGCQGNSQPIAQVDGDTAALIGDVISLDGSASVDPDGDPLLFSWEMTRTPKGSQATLTGLDLSDARFTPDLPGEYEVRLVVSDGELDSSPDALVIEAMPWFIEVTDEAGVPGGGIQSFVSGAGPGAAWGDYDNDGDLDLYVATDGPNMLYRSNGDGTFTDVASQAGVNGPCNSYGVAWGDYDNDGDMDLYVVCHSEDQGASVEHQAYEPNILYRNDGDGTFTNVAREAGVDHIAHGAGATWVDYDSDGLLDLYVANFGIYGDFGEGWGDGNVLYRNMGDGTFLDVTAQAGVRGHVGRVKYVWAGGDLMRSGMTFESLWFDYDNDGDPDFIECNDQGVSPLYRNNGDGTFSDVTEAAGLVILGSCMGIDAGDYDRDGDLDVYWTNYHENFLWRNNGDGSFTEVAEQAGVADFMVGWATGFVDFDNDGFLDIYVTNGLIGVSVEDGGTGGKSRLEPNVLYRNNGDGTFSDVTAMAGFGDPGVGRGTAVGDYNNDGALDFYVVNADGTNILYRNEIGTRNNWLKLSFEGSESNRDGVGVRVQIYTDEWSQIAEVSGGSGYLGGNGKELVCGLGQLTEVSRIEVIWPGGAVQSFRNVAVNQTIVVREPG
jgi:hypothetical protein